jgi:hypothetical protein
MTAGDYFGYFLSWMGVETEKTKGPDPFPYDPWLTATRFTGGRGDREINGWGRPKAFVRSESIGPETGCSVF